MNKDYTVEDMHHFLMRKAQRMADTVSQLRRKGEFRVALVKEIELFVWAQEKRINVDMLLEELHNEMQEILVRAGVKKTPTPYRLEQDDPEGAA